MLSNSYEFLENGSLCLTSNKLFDFHDWDPGILCLNFCHYWIGATCKNFVGSAALAGFDGFEYFWLN